MLFYATFTTGLHEPVSRLVKRAGLSIIKLLDGALVYESGIAKYLPCFVNVYEILSWRGVHGRGVHGNIVDRDAHCDEVSRNDTHGSDALKKFMKEAAANPNRFGLIRTRKGRQRTDGIPEKKRGFRIIVSVENRLVSTDANVKSRLEQHIAAHTGLPADRGGSGEEFWFLYRREGAVFFMRRLTTHTAYEKTLHKGELRPELAYMLNILAEMDIRFDTDTDTDTDIAPDIDIGVPASINGDEVGIGVVSDAGRVMLDPFCGYGAIPAARLRYFTDAAVYAADKDEEKTQITRAVLRQVRRRTKHGVKPNNAHAAYFSIPPRTAQSTRIRSAQTPRKSTASDNHTHVEVRHAGIDRLSSWLPKHSVDAIVTDPPWGAYDGMEVRPLYEAMLRNFLHVIKIGGTIVVLTSQKTLLRELLSCEKHRALVLTQSYDILVSGKKAGVFVLRRV